MFVFIAGVQPRTVSLPGRTRACPTCGSPRVAARRIDHYFTLFFVPLFPVRRGSPLLTCQACGAVVDGRETPTGAPRRLSAASRCEACGRRVEADFRFCPACGERLGS